MRKIYAISAALSVVFVLAGCGGKVFDVSAEHLRSAATELQTAREAGSLPDNDRWAECFLKVADGLDAIKGKVAEAGEDKLTAISPAMVLARLHIASMQTSAPPDADCAQVRLELLHKGFKLGANSFSGGSAGGALDLLKALPLPIGQ